MNRDVDALRDHGSFGVGASGSVREDHELSLTELNKLRRDGHLVDRRWSGVDPHWRAR
jgi:hypothetical protein